MSQEVWKLRGCVALGTVLGILSLPFPVLGSGLMVHHVLDGRYVAIPLLFFLIGIGVSGLVAAWRLVFKRSHPPGTLFGRFFFIFVVIAFMSVAILFFSTKLYLNGLFFLLVTVASAIELVRRSRRSDRVASEQ